MDRRLAKHDDDIAELKNKVDFFVQTQTPPLQGVFYDGQLWDAKSLLIKFIWRAKKELIVINPYVGAATLDKLAKCGRGVKIELVTQSSPAFSPQSARRHWNTANTANRLNRGDGDAMF